MHKYFLEPLDAHTNEVFARMLDASGACLHKAEHGKYKNVWECSLGERDSLIRSIQRLQLSFKVWRSFKGGTIVRWRPTKNLRLVLTVR